MPEFHENPNDRTDGRQTYGKTDRQASQQMKNNHLRRRLVEVIIKLDHCHHLNHQHKYVV